MPAQYPRREKRKQETREAILDAAVFLFSTRGFDETTLESIAERSNVHLQTLYRHFPTKLKLAEAIDRITLSDFVSGFENRSVDALTFWRNWVEEVCERTMEQGEAHRRALSAIFGAPTMSTTFLETWHTYHDTLVKGLAEDMGVDPEADKLPLLIGSMLWGGQLHTYWMWADGKQSGNLTENCLAVVDRVIEEYNDKLNCSIRDT